MAVKLVTIPHNGPIIPVLGGVYGPISHPHKMDMGSIRVLVSKGYPVDEHLENGKTIRLTLANYAKDHNAKEGIEVARPVEPVQTPEAPAAVVVEEEKVEAVETVAEEATEDKPAQKQGKKNRGRQDNVDKK